MAPEHREHLLQELGADGLALALQYGARTIDAAEAHAMGFRFKGWRGGGLLLPFSGDFAQLRCDDPPRARNGDPVKYLNRLGVQQRPVLFGGSDSALATEGWKDALRLHLATGKPVAGLPGVSNTAQLPPTVELLIYDADAAINPAVWAPLIGAGLERPAMRLAFFPREVAGNKGGAVEFFGKGGDLADVRRWKARELLRELPQQWDRTLRADWQARAVSSLARLAAAGGMGPIGAQQLAVAGAKAVGLQVGVARTLVDVVLRARRAKATTVPPDAPATTQLVAAAGAPPASAVNAGAWATALGCGIGSRLRRNLLTQEVELDSQPIRGEAEELLYVKAQQAGWKVKRADCYDGTRAVALEHAYHPVRKYLDRVVADPSIQPIDLDTIAARYLGVSDPLSAAMLRCLLIGAVARIHQPGCVPPGVVVLRGAQGIGKSGFWQALGGAFYVVSRHDDTPKDQALAMHGSWFYDFDELDKVTTARQAAGLRSLITTQADTFRVPYGRKDEQFPRQFVIVGAVNGDGFLCDPEGNRRYWVINCPQAKDSGQFIDGPGAARDRDAIWKAAVLAYRTGADWRLSPAHQAASNIRNGQWEAVDEWQAALAGWAESVATPGGFSTREAIAGAGLRLPESITRPDEMRAADALKRAGFQRNPNKTRRADGSRDRFWSLAQPAQPGPTCSEEVGPAETACDAVDLLLLAQPDQPLLGNARDRGIGVVDEGVHVSPYRGLALAGWSGGADRPKSTAAQSISPRPTTGPTSGGWAGGTPVTVDGGPGWTLPGAMPRGNGATVQVLLTNPQGRSQLVERSRIGITAAASANHG